MANFRSIILGALGIFLSHLLYAQDQSSFELKSLFSDNQEEIEALALYPDDIRDGIFELCLYPQLIVKRGAIQLRAQADFQDIIQYQTEEVQKNNGELLRYTGLMDKLVSDGQKAKKQIEDIPKAYPKDIHSIADSYHYHSSDVIVSCTVSYY